MLNGTSANRRGRQRRFFVTLLTLLLAGVIWGTLLHARAQGAVRQPLQQPAQTTVVTKMRAAIFGVVEGLTEYLPISSTGHLQLTRHFMGLENNKDEAEKTALDAYEVVIQAGAILAVLFLFFGRVRSVIEGLLGRNPAGLRLFANLLCGFLPAAVIGIIFEKAIKKYLFGMPWVVIAWFVGGIVILLMTRKFRPEDATKGKTLEELNWKESLGIGSIQCLAMWPGVSRSLSTIIGGLLVGLSPVAAVEFSFLLGFVTLSAATLKDAKEYGGVMIHQLGGMALIIGLVFAFLSAIIAVKWMVGYLNKHGLAIFGYYRIALAILIGAMLLYEAHHVHHLRTSHLPVAHHQFVQVSPNPDRT